ncbi:TPA: hypothetical protein ACH3X2_009246 [Trebouxia sp. C0005]
MREVQLSQAPSLCYQEAVWHYTVNVLRHEALLPFALCRLSVHIYDVWLQYMEYLSLSLCHIFGCHLLRAVDWQTGKVVHASRAWTIKLQQQALSSVSMCLQTAAASVQYADELQLGQSALSPCLIDCQVTYQ